MEIPDTSKMVLDVFDIFEFDDWCVVFRNGVFWNDNHHFDLPRYLHDNPGRAATVRTNEYIDLPEDCKEYLGLNYNNNMSLEEFKQKCEDGSIFARDCYE